MIYPCGGGIHVNATNHTPLNALHVLKSGRTNSPAASGIQEVASLDPTFSFSGALDGRGINAYLGTSRRSGCRQFAKSCRSD